MREWYILYTGTKGGRKTAELEGFKAFNFNEGVAYVSVTNNGVTFNRSVLLKLGCPQYVVLLINEEKKQIAVKKCAEEDANAVPFFKHKPNGVLSVRWNARDLLNNLSAMMGWDLEGHSYKAEGILLKDADAILFDFSKASELKWLS